MPRIEVMAVAMSSFALAALAGAETPDPAFLATAQARAFMLKPAVDAQELSTFGASGSPQHQAVTTDPAGRILVHAIVNGRGMFYRLARRDGDWKLQPLRSTDDWYSSVEFIDNRMIAVRPVDGGKNELVELDSFNFQPLRTLGSFDLDIGGIAYVPALGELIAGDSRTGNICAITLPTDTAPASVRVIGHSGIDFGQHGLEHFEGQVYGAVVTGQDQQLVFGAINLETGAFTIATNLGDAPNGGVGFGVIPGDVPLDGEGGGAASFEQFAIDATLDDLTNGMGIMSAPSATEDPLDIEDPIDNPDENPPVEVPAPATMLLFAGAAAALSRRHRSPARRAA